ncbi:mycocerosic acid synthase-like polyketide synthase isoform X2 [Nematostella vectensis]|uniref:mycocerosic acid synthase-like polyketide synthase isoform X2 n=1 Tax=Nematostella vectensis TaxID=45351 RepID=UPI002076F825|nr:mycocerosic acid synthase-like polyketide synthase isoform X2 [Nematostella vectensis]XP_048587066.1 mycocerosic acid synthase-like polyketide synthase isoform X2 [Nematostella vectensis]
MTTRKASVDFRCLWFLLHTRSLSKSKMAPEAFHSNGNHERNNLRDASRIFPIVDAWRSNVIFSDGISGNVFDPSSDCFKAAEDLASTVANRSFAFRNNCAQCNLPSAISKLTHDDIREITSCEGHAVCDIGLAFVSDTLAFTGVRVQQTYSNHSKASAKGILLTFYMKEPRTQKEKTMFVAFREDLYSISRKLSSQYDCRSTLESDRNNADKLWSMVTPTRQYLLYALPALIFIGLEFAFLFFTRSFFVLTALFVISINAALCTSVAFGVIFAFNIPYHDFFSIIPFYGFCQHLALCLILIKSVEVVSPWTSVRRQIRECMTKTGFVVTVTAIVAILLNCIAVWSCVTGVIHFMLLSFFYSLFTFGSLFLIVMPALVWIQRWFGPTENRLKANVRSFGVRKVSWKWAKLVSSSTGKIIVFGIALAIVAACVAYIVVTNPSALGSNRVTMLYDKHVKDEMRSGEDVILLVRDLEYANNHLRASLVDLVNSLSSTSHSAGKARSWLTSFEQWRESEKRLCTGGEFKACQQMFMNTTIGTLFKHDIRVRKGVIVESLIHLPMRQVTSAVKRDLIQLLNRSRLTKNVMILCNGFASIEDVDRFKSNVLISVAISLLCVTVVLFLVTASIRATIIIFFSFLMLALELVTLLCLFDVPLNQLTFVCSFPVFILSFLWSISVSQVFLISRFGPGRATRTVNSTFVPLLSALLAQIICSLALGLVFTNLDVVFLQVIPAFCLLGYLHASVLLPSILSTFEMQQRRLQIPDYFSQRFYNKRPDGFPKPVKAKLVEEPSAKVTAIIGIGCRFPLAQNKDEFWEALKSGDCGTSDFPENRKSEYQQFKSVYHPKRFVPGRICTTAGSYLGNIKGFDAGFFNISQQEANSMDPQQRILLEVVYEAIEDSGMSIEDLRACRTGVFVGAKTQDYGGLVLTDDNKTNLDQFAATGTARTIIANRISFCFNFTGPSFIVDTACSSSLIALRLAIESLENGDCEAAVVCASNIILSHMNHMVSSLAGLLAPDGRCKSFDSSGDGYGRGEGFAAVILKLKDTAVNDGDDIYSEIVSCGMNSDGSQAVPMTAPSVQGQAELARFVLKKSGLQADDIDYVEAHGTGTAIGDVVEITALSEVYCESINENSRTLRVGSVKSNINHTESTSGLAGVIKLALMIKNGHFVPTVNVQTVNPALKLDERRMTLQTVEEKWERKNGKPRIGAVSSYGFGGSNAHAILREFISSDQSPTMKQAKEDHVLTLSAKENESLHKAAKTLSAWLSENKDLHGRIAEVCYSLNKKTIHPHRMAIAFETVDEVIKLLQDFGADTNNWETDVSYGVAKEVNRKVVFMFGGQGPQWYGMAKELLDKEPAFLSTIKEIDGLLKDIGEEWNLLEELTATEEKSRLDDLVIGQTATFALQCGIARLLISWGIRPSAVIGHSLGELAAAAICGALPLKNVLSIVVLRASLQHECQQSGLMAALGMSEERARSLLCELKLDSTVNIAAVNDAQSVTLSGDEQSIEAFQEHLKLNNITCTWKILTTVRAFHSFHMAPIKTTFQRKISKMRLLPVDGGICFYSSVEGAELPGKELNEEYWWKNIRQPVEFHKATLALLRYGYRDVVEIGAQPTLAHYVSQIAAQEQIKGDDFPRVIPTLSSRKISAQHKTFLKNTACHFFTSGYPVLLSRVSPYSDKSKFIRLPLYSWHEKEYWFRSKDPDKSVLPLHTRTDDVVLSHEHPFLSKTVQTKPFIGLTCWDTEVDTYHLPYLKDHTLTQGGTIMPAAAYLEMAFAMSKETFMCSSLELKDVKFRAVLTLPEGQIRNMRMRLEKQGGAGEARYQITSVQEDLSEILLSSGRIACDVEPLSEKALSSELSLGNDVKELMQNMEEYPIEQFQRVRRRLGFSFGPAFSHIKRIWKSSSEILCLVETDEIEEQSSYVFHPCILDTCLQATIPDKESSVSTSTRLPTGFESVKAIFSPVPRQVFCHVNQSPSGEFDITQMTLEGRPFLQMKGLKSEALDSSGKGDQSTLDYLSFNVTWEHADIPESGIVAWKDVVYVVLKDSLGYADAFVSGLKLKGANVIALSAPESNNFQTKSDERRVEDAVLSGIAQSKQEHKKLKVVTFWPIQAQSLPESYKSIDHIQNLSLRSSFSLIKLMMNADIDNGLVLMVTMGTQFLSDVMGASRAEPMPWSSIVWGMRRSAAIEAPAALGLKVVDLSNQPTEKETQALINEVITEDREMEVAYSNGKRYVNRYVRLTEEDVLGDVASNVATQKARDVYLFKRNGSNANICFKELTKSSIQKGDVEIETTNLYSLKEQVCDFVEASSCIAFSGVVTGANSTSSRFKTNDRVCGIMSPCRVGEKVRGKEARLMIQPEALNGMQAATLPINIILAWKILNRALSDKKSAFVLIHEGDTGAGYTATAIANAMGHRTVCSTTQTGDKAMKALLQDVGVEAIMDPNCFLLGEEYDNQFDAVIFLSHPHTWSMKRSYSALKSNGKLVVACDKFTGHAILPGDRSFCYDRISPKELLTEGDESFEEMWLSCQSMLTKTGVLDKLLAIPQEITNVYNAVVKWNINGEVQEKVSTLYRSFVFDGSASPNVEIAGLDHFGMKHDRTYMVAGGVRGFGFEVARSMAENGAKTIVLLARSSPDDAKKQEIKELEEKTGARIIIEQVDLSSERQMKALELKLRELPSMAGIVHTAVVLNDAFVHNMDLDSFKVVLAPKVTGAYLLHKMSLQMDLDFFVLFSSLASVMGGRGQSAYSAGNAFKDGLAAYRRHVLGLPGLAINWGPIGGAGLLTRQQKIAKMHAEYGFGLLDAARGANFLLEILKCQPSRCQVTLSEIDWPRFFKSNEESALSKRVEHLREEVNHLEQHADATASLASRTLFERDTAARNQLIEEFVITTLTRCFEMDSFSETDQMTSLYSFGVDSITALTLKVAFETSLQISFETFYFLQPDTNAQKVIKDIQEMISHPEVKQETQKKQDFAGNTVIEQEDNEFRTTNNHKNGPNDDSFGESKEMDGLSDKPSVKVVPVYTPDEAEVKLFCIHPSHRYAMSVAPFASGFRSQTLVSMYSIGYTDPTFLGSWSSVRELATHYVALMRNEQKHGPYFICGYSFGGLVAFEMASICTEQGEKVAFVCMIDTYVWSPSSGGFGRFTSHFLQDITPEDQVELQFEEYMLRIAVKSLKMREDEYQSLRKKHSMSEMLDLLQKRSRDLDLSLFSLQAMWDSLLHDQVISSKTHDEWEPPKVQYEGPVLYIRSENPKYSPVLWHYKSSDRAWADVLPGPTDVCMCPGDHYSMGQLPDARPVGMIMVNSISFRYRTMFPELYQRAPGYKQRRALKRFTTGVVVVLYGEGGKRSKAGELTVNLNRELRFKNTSRFAQSASITIPLKEVRSVLPGKYVTHATRKWARKSRDPLLRDLGNVVSIFANRTYDFEFANIEERQLFVSLAEVVFDVNIADLF